MGPYLETDLVGENVDESEDGGGGDVGGELFEDGILGSMPTWQTVTRYLIICYIDCSF